MKIMKSSSGKLTLMALVLYFIFYIIAKIKFNGSSYRPNRKARTVVRETENKTVFQINQTTRLEQNETSVVPNTTVSACNEIFSFNKSEWTVTLLTHKTNINTICINQLEQLRLGERTFFLCVYSKQMLFWESKECKFKDKQCLCWRFSRDRNKKVVTQTNLERIFKISAE